MDPTPTPRVITSAWLKTRADVPEGICGARFRRSMYESPGSRVCIKPTHEGHRHSDKAPEKPSLTPSGTCQICFRNQKTRKGNLVLHGYTRPGWGYTVGKCWGCDYAPFEVSCERTKQFLAEVLRPSLARFEAHLLDLQQNPPADLSYSSRVWVGYRNAKSGYKGVTVQVLKGEGSGYKATDVACVENHGQVKVGDMETIYHPSYDQLLTSEKQDTERRIAAVKRDIASFEKTVAEWKPVAWPVKKVVA